MGDASGGPTRPPSTGADIEAAYVPGAAPSRGPIRLVEYDPLWPSLFEQEAERIGEALGDSAIRIEHVGSTAVSGLAAKPIVDVVLVVLESADEASYVPALEAAGYTLRIREPDWFEHRVLGGPDVDVNLHVFSDGCPEIDRMLAFRNRIRANVADRIMYERAKRDLANRNWAYVQNYADAKSAVIEEILERASRGE